MTKTPAPSPSGSKTQKMKHDCKFKDSWVSEFKYVSASKKGDTFAFCEICNTNVSIRNGGKNDLSRHMNGKQHQLKESAVSSADEQQMMERINRSKRRSRVDYRKLSLGDTDWKPDEEEEEVEKKPVIKTRRQKQQGLAQEKKTAVKSVSTETYLMMLYVTLEQENAMKEFFEDHGWAFLKPDLSALTENSGPTFLNNQGGNESQKPDDISGSTQGKSDASSPIKHTGIVKKVKQTAGVEDQMENSLVNLTPSKKRKRDRSPEVVSQSENTTPDKNVLEEASDDRKMDGTESISPQVDEENTKPLEGAPDGEDPVKTCDGDITETEKTSSSKALGQDEIIKADAEENVEEADEMDTDDDSIDEAPIIRCWSCEQVLKDHAEYDDHMLKVHMFDTKKGRYYCEKCDKHFKQPDYLKDHNEHVHEGKKRKPQKTTRDNVCDICGRGFKRPDQLKEHRSMVHFKKPLTSHACDVCGKKFSRPRLLGYHMNKHVGHKPFQCSTCGNSYFSRGGLYVHSRMCQRVNPMIYECEICNKRFSNQYALKVHKNGIHSQTQVCYKCDCGKLLKYKSSIGRHRSRCPINSDTLTEITREEYNQGIAPLNSEIIGNTEKMDGEEDYEEINVKDEAQVSEVTDERIVEEITVKIADELNKSGKVNTEDERLITDTIRNAVLSVDETQVITIPSPSGVDGQDHVYYVIVNPSTEEQT